MQNPDKGGEKWDLGIRDLKIFRVISRGIKHVYLKEGEKVFETSMDPVEVLGLYAHKGEIMRRETRIDFENLLIKDFSHAEDRVTLPFDPPEVWGSGITYEMSRRRYSEEKVPKIMDKRFMRLSTRRKDPRSFLRPRLQDAWATVNPYASDETLCGPCQRQSWLSSSTKTVASWGSVPPTMFPPEI